MRIVIKKAFKEVLGREKGPLEWQGGSEGGTVLSGGGGAVKACGIRYNHPRVKTPSTVKVGLVYGD